MRIVDANDSPLTPWYSELAYVLPDNAASGRLSGNGMRNHLFFATAPGNARLYVAKTRNGLFHELPAGSG